MEVAGVDCLAPGDRLSHGGDGFLADSLMAAGGKEARLAVSTGGRPWVLALAGTLAQAGHHRVTGSTSFLFLHISFLQTGIFADQGYFSEVADVRNHLKYWKMKVVGDTRGRF